MPAGSEFYFNPDFTEKLVFPAGYIFGGWKALFCAVIVATAVILLLKLQNQPFTRERRLPVWTRREVVTVLLITLAGLILRLLYFNRAQVNYLEWWTTQVAMIHSDWTDMFFSRSAIAVGHSVVYNFFIRFLEFMTSSLTVHRAIFCAINLLCLPVFYRLVRSFQGSATSAFALVLFSMNASFLSESSQYQIYSVHILLVLLQLNYFVRVFRFGREKDESRFIFLSVIGLMIHYFIVIVFFQELLYLFWGGRKLRRQIPRFLRHMSVTALFSLPVFPYVLSTFERGENIFNPVQQNMYFPASHLLSYLPRLPAGHAGLPVDYLIPSLILVVLFLFHIRSRVGAGRFAIASFAAHFLGFLGMNVMMALNFGVSYPDYRHFLALSFTFSFAGAGLFRRKTYWLAVVILAAMTVGLMTWKNHSAYPDFSEAASFVQDSLGEKDMITFGNNLWREPFFHSLHPLSGTYLYNRSGWRPLNPDQPEGKRYYYRDLRRGGDTGDAENIWLIRGKVLYFGSEAYSQGLDEIVINRISSGYKMKLFRNFGLTRVEMYEKIH